MSRSRSTRRVLAAALVALASLLAPAGGLAAPAVPGPARPAPDVDRAALKAEAAALVRAGDIRGARERYLRVLERFPNDLEARFGHARTSAWLEDYGTAEASYREGLARDPRSVEGLLGLADVLAWTGRYGEALDRLADADAVEPGNPEVWRRRGRFNRWRGERTASRAAYRRTLELAPGDEEATRVLAELAAETSSTLDLAYSYEKLSTAKAVRLGTDSNNLASAQYTYTGFERLTFLGRVNYSDRFGDDQIDADDFQITGGVAWRFRPRTTIRLEASGAPDADVLPAFAGEVELLQGLGFGDAGTLVFGVGYRYLDFNRVVRPIGQDELGEDEFQIDPETTVHILTPSVEWATPWPLTLLVRYYFSISDFEGVPALSGFPGSQGGTDETSSVLVKATLFPQARFEPFVAYARGVESFATAAQLRGLTTDSYAAGATIRLTRHFGVRAAYEYQDAGRDTQGGTITQSNISVGTFLQW